MARRKEGRETWHRLLDWDKGQAPSERLAASLVASDGYIGLDPSHPLGGKDGGKDAILQKDGLKMILAVYFARGQQSFGEIRRKFECDLDGVKKNNAGGIVFFTNQEVKLAERALLSQACSAGVLDLFHIERITTLLNTPAHFATRLEFLDMEMTQEELVAVYEQRDRSYLQQLTEVTKALKHAKSELTRANEELAYLTGGDSIPVLRVAMGWIVMGNRGRYPLRNVHLRIRDMDLFAESMKDAATEQTDPYVLLDIAQTQHDRATIHRSTQTFLKAGHMCYRLMPVPTSVVGETRHLDATLVTTTREYGADLYFRRMPDGQVDYTFSLKSNKSPVYEYPSNYARDSKGRPTWDAGKR